MTLRPRGGHASPVYPSRPWWFQSRDNDSIPRPPSFPPSPPPPCRPAPSSAIPNGCCVLSTTGTARSWRTRPLPMRHPRHSLIHFPTHQPIDFDAEVNLFHFNLLRCVGKGAFGKVYMGSLSSDVVTFVLIAVCRFTPIAGPSRTAQADERPLRPQVHQQGSLRQTESRLEYRPREKVTRRGSLPHPGLRGRHPLRFRLTSRTIAFP